MPWISNNFSSTILDTTCSLRMACFFLASQLTIVSLDVTDSDITKIAGIGLILMSVATWCSPNMYIIGVSLSDPHHVRSTVKSVFLLACLCACHRPLYG